MQIDSHTHLNFTDFDKDRDEVIHRALDNNVWMINVGTDCESSKRAIEIAEKYKEGVYASIGIHPSEIQNNKAKFKIYLNVLKNLAGNEIVMAIGEIGLDYKYLPKDKKQAEEEKKEQKELFEAQLDLARELNLPVIIHCRDAFGDLIELLNKFQISNYKLRGVVHCFTGDLEMAWKFIEMGFYIGFTGIIFRKSEEKKLENVIKNIPFDRILVETDCPFLSPPMADKKRNEPIFVKYIIQKISEIKKIEYQEVEEKTVENAEQLFNIK